MCLGSSPARKRGKQGWAGWWCCFSRASRCYGEFLSLDGPSELSQIAAGGPGLRTLQQSFIRCELPQGGVQIWIRCSLCGEQPQEMDPAMRHQQSTLLAAGQTIALVWRGQSGQHTEVCIPCTTSYSKFTPIWDRLLWDSNWSHFLGKPTRGRLVGWAADPTALTGFKVTTNSHHLFFYYPFNMLFILG